MFHANQIKSLGWKEKAFNKTKQLVEKENSVRLHDTSMVTEVSSEFENVVSKLYEVKHKKDRSNIELELPYVEVLFTFLI